MISLGVMACLTHHSARCAVILSILACKHSFEILGFLKACEGGAISETGVLTFCHSARCDQQSSSDLKIVGRRAQKVYNCSPVGCMAHVFTPDLGRCKLPRIGRHRR